MTFNKTSLHKNFSRVFSTLTPTRFLVIWTLIVSFASLIGTFAKRAYYADGSFFFLQVLQNGWADDTKHQRLFINFLNQGLTHLLRYTPASFELMEFSFNFSLFFVFIILSVIAALRLIKYGYEGLAILYVAIITASVYPSFIFVLNPAISYMAVVAVHLAFVLTRRNQPLFSYGVIFATSLILLRGHETTLYLAPLLILWLVYLGFKEKTANVVPIIAAHLMGFSYSVWWLYSHPIGDLSQSYASLLIQILVDFQDYIFKTNLMYTILLAFLVTTAMLVELNRLFVKRKFFTPKLFDLCALATIFVGFSHCWYACSNTWFNPWFEYRLRVLMTPAAIGLLCVTFVPVFWNAVMKSKLLKIGILSLTFFHMTWQIQHSVLWFGFFRTAEAYVYSLDTVTAHPNHSMLRNPQYEWSWTWPAFSMILQNGEVNVLIRPNATDVFDSVLVLPKSESEPVFIPFDHFYDSKYIEINLIK